MEQTRAERNRTLALLFLVLAMVVSGVASFVWQKEPFSRQKERLTLDEHEGRLEWYRKAAEQGNAAAQFNLGVLYANGKGVPQSYEEAAKWWRKAAEQGDAAAQFNLGILYANGKVVPQSYEEAAKWWRKAAEQGNVAAQFNLGVLYANGKVVPQSYEEAAKWFRKAAEQGMKEAQFRLGLCYYKGGGVPQSYEEAAKWFRKAAEQGFVPAMEGLDVIKLKENARRTLASSEEGASEAGGREGFAFCGIALGSVKEATAKNDEGYPLYTGKLGQPFRGIDEVRCFLTPSKRQVFGIRLAKVFSSYSEMCKELETIKRLLEIKYGKTPDRVEKNDAQNDDYYWFLEDGTIVVNLDAPTDKVMVLDVVSIPLQQKAEEELRQKTLEENAADLKAL